MGLIEDLNEKDQELKTDIAEFEEKEAERRDAEREKRVKKEKERKEKVIIEKTEAIKDILEDKDESLDEPRIYRVEYKTMPKVGEIKKPGIEGDITTSMNVIMTERTKKIGEILNNIHPNDDNYMNIKISERPSKEASEKEKIEMNAIKEKVDLVKKSSEFENDCALELYDEEVFDVIHIDTKLGNALLGSMGWKNGKFEIKNKSKNSIHITFEAIKEAIEKKLKKMDEKI